MWAALQGPTRLLAYPAVPGEAELATLLQFAWQEEKARA
jgi:hypothetical protein